MDIRKLDQSVRSKLRKINYESLEYNYKSVVKVLNIKYQPELEKTYHEDKVANLIKANSKILFERSIWIGKRNIDFFLPYLAGNFTPNNLRFKGLAIEVDGPIHNEYQKMQRDNSKYKHLHDIGIAVYTIENSDLLELTFSNMLKSFGAVKKIDYRAKRRLYRNIFIKTILENEDIVRDQKLPIGNYLIQLLKGTC